MSDKKIDAERLEKLKGIIRDLHAGAGMEGLKRRFSELVKDVSPEEISRMEQELMDEGLPQEEVKRLCDVHVEIFKDALDKQAEPSAEPGHPVHTFMAENEALGKVADEFLTLLKGGGGPLDPGVSEALERLSEVERHYQRKENQLFPFLEKHGVTGPSQVMWAIHDDVRELIRRTRKALEEKDPKALAEKGSSLVEKVVDMIYKENNILFPMSLKTLEEPEWVEIRKGEDDIGYALVTPGDGWKPGGAVRDRGKKEGAMEGLKLDTGNLSLEQVNLILKNLPVDLTFVDENDEVRYFSAGRERIFPRSPGIIGRKVQNCHPRKSLDKVNRIVEEFRKGSRDSAEFWIQIKGKFIYIRYFAVRDGDGKYKGVLEVSQDVTDIKKLEGEKRLLD